MAIYHCTTKPISRSSGRSATASSAYRTAQKIVDMQTGEIHDYTRKQGVIHAEIIPPKNINIKEVSREDLWNLAEQSEKRKDARVAREFIIALPHEISRERQIEVAKEFSQYLSDKYEVVADLAIHEPSKEGSDKNVHAHIMITTRKIAVDKENKAVLLTEKSTLELSNSKRKSLGLKATQDDIKDIREKWADMANNTLKKEGLKVRIDHRSYADQEKEQIPTKHEGVAVTELRRKGKIIGVARLNEEIKEENRFIRSIRIEGQQNHKPGFFERIGIKKVKKIEENLPPIRKIIDRIDKRIVEAQQLKLKASYEKITIENEMQADIRTKERTEKEAKVDPLEREYKQIVYGNPEHGISTFKGMLEMNRFTAEVKASGNKTKLIEALVQKKRHPETTKQSMGQNPLVLGSKALVDNNSTEKEHIEPKTAEIKKQKLMENESVKTEFFPETRKQFHTRNSIARQDAKIKDDGWNFDR